MRFVVTCNHCVFKCLIVLYYRFQLCLFHDFWSGFSQSYKIIPSFSSDFCEQLLGSELNAVSSICNIWENDITIIITDIFFYLKGFLIMFFTNLIMIPAIIILLLMIITRRFCFDLVMRRRRVTRLHTTQTISKNTYK